MSFSAVRMSAPLMIASSFLVAMFARLTLGGIVKVQGLQLFRILRQEARIEAHFSFSRK
ncbi:MAG: hypothetical protein PVI25_08020 [Gammaproteobacteria bacterium]|jgi:hypothetical protein